MMASVFSLSLRERAGVRGSRLRSKTPPDPQKPGSGWEGAALQDPLTPAPSRGEREKVAALLPASMGRQRMLEA